MLAACSNGVGQLPVGDASPEIFYSSAAEGAAPSGASLRALDGSTVSGSVFVFVQEHPAIAGTELYYDDPNAQGEPLITMAAAPFGATLDTTRLENGNHTLTAVVRLEGASELVQTAEFEVQNEASDPGEPGDAVEPAPAPQPSHPLVPPLPAAPTEADYFVATNGSDSNDGRSIDSPFRTIGKAAEVVEPGDVVFIRGGRYTEGHISFERSGTEEAPITFMSYPGEWAVLDFSSYQGGEDSYRVWIEGVRWNIFRNFEVYQSPQQGIFIRGNASDNLFVNIVIDGSWGSGMQIWTGSRNRFYYSVARNNYGGGNADGFGSIGQGGPSYDNAFYYCLSERNSDDGFDSWQGRGTIMIGNVSRENGYNGGNGQGFKLGRGFPPDGVWTADEGDWYQADGIIMNNVAYNNSANGFDTNTGAGNLIVNNTAWNNGHHDFLNTEAGNNPVSYDGNKINVWKNNLSLGGSVSMNSQAQQDHNSWNLGIDDAQVLSRDENSTDFLSLAAGSEAIDAGADVELPYVGAAHDLGALEYGQSLAKLLEPTFAALRLAGKADGTPLATMDH